MIQLLDSNLLIALLVVDHVHYRSARTWLIESSDPIATCPITQGSLVRELLRTGVPATDATAVLAGLTGHQRHEFLPDDIGYHAVPMRGVLGHRQVTDAYLAQLARHHHARLATFDKGLAALHDDVAVLVPSNA
ncbi:MAG: TA system VapC family ribonuclease toxin [Micromonosporaceae bacterium]